MAENEVRITLRLPAELADAVRKVAAMQHRSMNAEIVGALEARYLMQRLTHALNAMPEQIREAFLRGAGK